ncbi:hypothetical protein GCM10010842_20900 [Deinococcus daejeonensis]|uniref:Uncharacterized protein n=1 Tax=Deinococcus daejeonensis TaxID=1007098 RepID=A0ABQ2J3I7_9DEIO|nr:hypothetical protein GCM10010842_20900 [Deinococcus daejeonensis]
MARVSEDTRPGEPYTTDGAPSPPGARGPAGVRLTLVKCSGPHLTPSGQAVIHQKQQGAERYKISRSLSERTAAWHP